MAKKIDPDKKVKEGWVRSTMMIEVLAITKDAAKDALQKHIEKMEKIKTSFVYKKDFKDPLEIKDPFPNVKKAYSYLVDIELVTKDFESLLILVLNFAPSSVEILEPKQINLKMGEAQSILVSIAEMIHKFARAGMGGVLISS